MAKKDLAPDPWELLRKHNEMAEESCALYCSSNKERQSNTFTERVDHTGEYLYKAGDIIKHPNKSEEDYKFESLVLSEFGIENEIRKDKEGNSYIEVIKVHDVDGEIENGIYNVGELKTSHFCNRKVVDALIDAMNDRGFVLGRKRSDEKYIYFDVLRIVGENWVL